MGISKEISEFAEVMTNRMRHHDETLGTNNYVTNTTVEEALQQLNYLTTVVHQCIEGEQKILAKTKCVDLANSAMILWKKL